VHRLSRSRVLAIVAVSLIAMAGGALLALWQWHRYQSSTGTLQNLGYVLQWPLFGVFPAVLFWRIHRAAQQERALDAAQAEPASSTTEPAESMDSMTYAQNRAVAYADGEDAELLAYNQYLAQLADREQRNAG
jgi:DNA-binding transcriptional regulator of glucitol operon